MWVIEAQFITFPRWNRCILKSLEMLKWRESVMDVFDMLGY